MSLSSTLPRLLCCLSLVGALAALDRDATRAELHRLADTVVLDRIHNLSNTLNEPSVVAIHTRQIRPVFRLDRRIVTDEVKVGDGSGFIFHSDATGSFILTNAHVVLRADHNQEFIHDRQTGQAVWHDRIQVDIKGYGGIDATPVGADVQTDLAVLRVTLPNLPTIAWADSDQAQIGDTVMALGFPFGVGYTATFGRISGTSRETGIYGSVGGYEGFLQTDAAINPGNSGGPLVDLRGEVVGVNANIYTKTGANVGIGFAIPSNLARAVAEDLRLDGSVSRPVIGIQVWSFNNQELETLGVPNRLAVKVVMVMPDSPAATAGLQIGDAILAVDGAAVTGLQAFRSRIASKRIDERFSLQIWRAGEARTVDVVPVSREHLEQALRRRAGNRVVWQKFGLELVHDDKRGILIDAVTPGSPAGRAGLRRGDRIFNINEVGQLEGLEELANLDAQDSLVLEVYHQGRLYLIRLAK